MSMTSAIDEAPPAEHSQPPRKLRLLCLHGFRQTATQFRGRTHAFCRRLKHVVGEFVFIDAPHELPVLVKATPDAVPDTTPAAEPVPDRTLPARPKRAWLVSPAQLEWQAHSARAGVEPLGWEQAPAELLAPQAHLQQTAGWPQSRDTLLAALHDQGPFDGVLGFSQGAAAATLLAAHLHEQTQQGTELSGLRPSFVILVSGFPPPGDEHGALLQRLGPLPLPSLHIFSAGQSTGDRQIGGQESQALVEMYAADSRVVVPHHQAHILPHDQGTVQAVKDFLQPFTAGGIREESGGH